MSDTPTTPTSNHSGTWDPGQYLRHAGNRSRPFYDLVARIPPLPGGDTPRVTDLGCGPGNLTASLLDRWPAARITGVDSSAEMLTAAEHLAGPTARSGSLHLTQADIATWTPDAPHDLILSNAALQWVPDHWTLFPAWVAGLRPGGVLALQMPGNFTSPSHTLLFDVANRPHWRRRLAHATGPTDRVLTPEQYLRRLSALGCDVDVWETTYLHVLQGDNPVLDWVRGTALRPVLDALPDPADQQAFLEEYGELLRAAYPPEPFGTVLPFRRVFAVAVRRADT
ncbi:trans-aconitate methyltransferase [Wenjunlia vitaminophila]|uniref:Trans-aconitate 2-methyltransferase n=1 Tax=Wenjunlia vitaminophila TaxID=76728 RepID=A0A0T6LRS7_WENVI|nr:trans-aconitate 2-methyltransferase [Wenjunlia vitaminophila]KRV48846.1 trans-aconitate methyltransferase [Wenjunlia vitaminophila]